ncbi:MAG: tetratricopeptide repeat protein, partial [Bryobacteraceae bacterium]
PNAFKAHNNLAVILANRGDLIGATEHLREAVRLEPDVPEVHTELADVLERQGQHAEAQRQLAQARRLQAVGTAH